MAQFASDPEKHHCYWLPVLGLFTGARINELCQINPQKDVVELEGVWCIHLTADSEGDERITKSIKTGKSRIVPLHPEVVRLGFLDYTERIKQDGHKLLFPAFKPKVGKASANAREWFAKLLKDVGIRDETLGSKLTTAMTNGAEFPPIHLAKVKDALIIVDGWHRHAALHSLGHREVSAKVTPMTQDEALRASALANTKHGKPLKSSERRNVFKNFIRGKGHKKPDGKLMTYREIAEALGGHVGHTTIYNWMRKDFPRVFKAMGVEVERGKGNGDPPLIDVETEYYRDATQAFTDTMNFFKLLTDPENRYEIIQQVEKGLAEMKTYEHHAPDF